ncbi:MAG: ACT domain-containing protein [Clostridia bacterium]|jgi:ACT domain-containing protein|nr:ACT domain-containing protein [Clostridia bacterium]
MRAVVTVTGSDKRGIIAKVSGFLFERNVNIEDISQTVLGEQFAMIMMVDTSDSSIDFSALALDLENMGKEIGMNIRLQHEAIFSAMHNV